MTPLTPTDLFALLDRLGLDTRTAHHPPVFTVAESRLVKEAIPGAHTKNLFLKDKAGRLFLVVAPAEAGIDLKRLAPLIGAAGRLSFGSADALREVLGVEPGSVTPFAAANDRAGRVQVVLDAGLMAAERVNVHPLANTMTTTIAAGDLVAFLRATAHEPAIVALPERAEAAGPTEAAAPLS